MTETEETVLDPRSLVKALLQAHDDWSGAAGTPLYGEAADALNKAEAAVVAALSRAPEAEELGSSTRMTSPASRSQTPLSAGWQEIESNPPPHNKAVLLGWRVSRDGRWISEVAAYSTGQQWASGFSNQSFHGSATHWTPVPAPPAEEDLSGAQRSELSRLAQDESGSSPPSTGGEGEAVAWAMLQRDGSVLSVQAKPYHEGFAQMMATDCGCTVQPLYLHPSPEMGEISREELVEIIDRACLHFDDPTFPRFGAPQAAELILTKLKENGLSREGRA